MGSDKDIKKQMSREWWAKPKERHGALRDGRRDPDKGYEVRGSSTKKRIIRKKRERERIITKGGFWSEVRNNN
jgi:hypothetical protein